MSQETTILLKGLLYAVKSAETYEDAVRAIEVVCEEDWIASVEKKIAEKKAAEKK